MPTVINYQLESEGIFFENAYHLVGRKVTFQRGSFEDPKSEPFVLWGTVRSVKVTKPKLGLALVLEVADLGPEYSFSILSNASDPRKESSIWLWRAQRPTEVKFRLGHHDIGPPIPRDMI